MKLKILNLICVKSSTFIIISATFAVFPIASMDGILNLKQLWLFIVNETKVNLRSFNENRVNIIKNFQLYFDVDPSIFRIN